MEQLGKIVCVVLEAMLTVFCAELMAGPVHWFEDAYIREDTPLIGRLLGRPNILHHHYPRYMTRNNWWQSSYDLVLFGIGVVLTAWMTGVLTWEVWVFSILCANANEIHKWTHRTRGENGRVITLLQDMRILQTQKHHLIHHKDPKNSHYCTMTNHLNPVLDAIHFWEALEWVAAHTVGLRRRPDSSLRDAGQAPAWLQELVTPNGAPAKRCKPARCARCVSHTSCCTLAQSSQTALTDITSRATSPRLL